MRGLVKGKRWLLLTRWLNLSVGKRQDLNQPFALNRKLFKAYILKESLDRLWNYRYEGAMLNYLRRWIDQLRWQRLQPFQELAIKLLDHLDGILNYCRTIVRTGVVEGICSFRESGLKCVSPRIPAESRFSELLKTLCRLRIWVARSCKLEGSTSSLRFRQRLGVNAWHKHIPFLRD